jgi:hypothetical protein
MLDCEVCQETVRSVGRLSAYAGLGASGTSTASAAENSRAEDRRVAARIRTRRPGRRCGCQSRRIHLFATMQRKITDWVRVVLVPMGAIVLFFGPPRPCVCCSMRCRGGPERGRSARGRRVAITGQSMAVGRSALSSARFGLDFTSLFRVRARHESIGCVPMVRAVQPSRGVRRSSYQHAR